MNQDLWGELPLEIFIDILSRLSLRNIATCKCVCKSWLNLIESDDFLKLGLSKSAPALVVSLNYDGSNWFSVFKLDDFIPLTASNWFNFSKLEAKHKHDPITRFGFPRAISSIHGSSTPANGLLLLINTLSDDHLYVCNPITREFVELHGPRPPKCLVDYGLGVSKISGQHKVVLLNPDYECHHVLTLETAGSSWRRVAFWFDRSGGAFVNGNLYWLFSDIGKIPYVCCHKAETECFSIFPDGKRRDDVHCRLYTENGEVFILLLQVEKC